MRNMRMSTFLCRTILVLNRFPSKALWFGGRRYNSLRRCRVPSRMESRSVLSTSRRSAATNLVLLCLALLALGVSAEPAAPAVALPERPGSPAAAFVQRVLERAEHPRLRWPAIADVREPLDTFYRARAYEPAWIRAGAVLPVVPGLISVLGGAAAQGLEQQDYDVRRLEEWLPGIGPETAPEDLALFDTALTVSLARYASSVHRGRVQPMSAGFRLDIDAEKALDLPAVFGRVLGGTDPADVFAALEPRSILYGQLKAELGRMRSLTADAVDRRLSLDRKLVPGDRSPEVPKLRAILNAADATIPAPEPGADADRYDPALADAVKRFQHRHGLEPDGVVGKGTVERLRVTDADRILQIQLAMERQRWLPERAAGRHLLVNVPSFELSAYSEGLGVSAPDLSMKVIVGQAVEGRRTPLFAADMTYLVFRPHWNLPYKIATREMLPGALRNPGYLSRHNIEVVSGYGGNAAVYAPTRENLRRVSGGALKLRQRPGPKNALGLVKFAFPNDDSVYLHSTPNPGLFARTRRDFSHGCIRVADPVALAEWVLGDDAA
ncbi:MAG: hypothetical protein FJ189_04435, partial [Gammaproteobacteria bacterium]|nr:hypothetical protein [Gammaproteobacteria bacterium]